jgi:hypothetical protein
MKKLVWTISLIILVSFAAVTCFADDIYWDRENLPSTDITSKDFKFKYGSSDAKSLGDMEIYDAPKPDPLSERPTEPQPEPTRVVAPINPTPPERTTPKQDKPVNVNPRTPSNIQKPSDTTDSLSTTIQKKELSKPESIKENIPPAPTTAETQKSTNKKMKWGRTEEAKPIENQVDTQSDDSKPKYRWGQ